MTTLHDDRREFLKAAGKFALIAPLAMTLLLSTAMTSSAIAKCNGKGNEGCGDGVDGDPRRTIAKTLPGA